MRAKFKHRRVKFTVIERQIYVNKDLITFIAYFLHFNIK